MQINNIDNNDELKDKENSFLNYQVKSLLETPDISDRKIKSVAASGEKNADNSSKSGKKASDFVNNSDNNNRTINVFDRTLRFEFKDEKTEDGNVEKKLVISVIDQATGRVIRRIPPEELKQEVKNLSDFMGVVLDKVC